MDLPFHAEIMRAAVGEFFDATAMEQILAGNFSQDSFRNLLGDRPQLHFDDDKIAEALAYVEDLRTRIIALAVETTDTAGAAQRHVFGQLCHTVQDFYAHSNYVDLWLAANGGLSATAPESIPALDEEILQHPDLHTGSFVMWRDIIFYIPLLKYLARKIYIPPQSHEAMHLDNPSRGEKFPYARAAAVQRTRWEYHRTVESIVAHGGETALQRFLAAEQPSV